jgi:hypothetical protein
MQLRSLACASQRAPAVCKRASRCAAPHARLQRCRQLVTVTHAAAGRKRADVPQARAHALATRTPATRRARRACAPA